MNKIKYFEIKSIYTEFPDVDVIELKDGTFIGINSETIVHYHGELFADDNEIISRPDTKEYLSVHDDGVQRKWHSDQIDQVFSDKTLISAIKILDVGGSVNWHDGIAQSLSVVRTR